MRRPRFKHEVCRVLSFEPFEELLHFPAQSASYGCFIMNTLFPDRLRNDLHRPFLVVSSATHGILDIPLRPVGNKAACQSNKRFADNG